MIRHLVMLNFKPEMGENERDELCRNTVQTLAQIPVAHNVCIGRAANAGTARYAFTLFIDFDDEAALKAYVDHPLHRGVAAKLPSMISDSSIVDYHY